MIMITAFIRISRTNRCTLKNAQAIIMNLPIPIITWGEITTVRNAIVHAWGDSSQRSIRSVIGSSIHWPFSNLKVRPFIIIDIFHLFIILLYH